MIYEPGSRWIYRNTQYPEHSANGKLLTLLETECGTSGDVSHIEWADNRLTTYVYTKYLIPTHLTPGARVTHWQPDSPLHSYNGKSAVVVEAGTGTNKNVAVVRFDFNGQTTAIFEAFLLPNPT